ncbi:MAG: hypothetical protein NTX25_23260 [Proteobacteria bacterium]|nr:hypothetical protein [Pseudomonadota bacterium]
MIATMGQVEIYLDKAKCDADDKHAVEMLKQKALGAFAVWQFFHPDDLDSKDFQEFESLIEDFDSLSL